MGQPNPTFNVASFNLRLDTFRDGMNAWPKRRAFVLELIRYHEFDIIGTQELLYNQIVDLQGMEGFAYTGVGRDDGKRAGEFSAIFYRTDRFRLLQSGDFWLSETPDTPSRGWDARCCNRLCSWAHLLDTLSGVEFFVFNAHFDHQGEVARLESAKLLVSRMQSIAQGHPIILTGDLNTTPGTEPILVIETLLRDSHTVSEMPPYGPVGTFSGFRINAPLANRIDYVFVSNTVRVHKYGALTDSRHGRFPSDHLPVVVRLSFMGH